jgi:outer membrane protein assembly factor BamD (BamD/ComL family)
MGEELKHPLKVFLCHASSDKPLVRALYQRLVQDGVDAWLDKAKLLPGQDWGLEIPKAVKESDVVIVCLSKGSVTKEGYVQKEIKIALDAASEKPEGTIFLIPARLEECDVPSQLGLWHWVDLFEPDGYELLMRSLRLRAERIGAYLGNSLYVNKELAQKIDQLYTDGLAAFWVEDWDKACYCFQTILRYVPNDPQASLKLEEAELQKRLNTLYLNALEAQKSEDWNIAVEAFEKLTRASPDYKDASILLKEAQKKNRLTRLYEEARKLHKAQQWQAVVRVFEHIAVIEPDYPDPDGLLLLAQNKVAEFQRLTELNSLYARAVREMDAGRWHEAYELFKQIRDAEPAFLETERLVGKVEIELKKAKEKQEREDKINTLYEQAHGLVRSKNWREALQKIEDIQTLDPQFEDKDEIAKSAKAALEVEEQQVQNQNLLAAMYADAVRLLREEKYQEALDKWQEIKTIEPKYPDRQWVQRTARKKLTEAKRVVGTDHITFTRRKSLLSFFIIIVLILCSVTTPSLVQFALGLVNPTTTLQPTRTRVPATPTLKKDLTSADYGDLLFNEDFNSNSISIRRWELEGSRVENDTLIIRPNGAVYPYKFGDIPTVYTNFILESQFSNPEGSTYMSFYLRFQKTPCSNCSIQIEVSFSEKTIIGRRVRGATSYEDITTPKSIQIDPNQWTKITIKAEDINYRVYINDVFVVSFTDYTYTSGTFVLDNGSEEVKVDYVRIYALP